MNYRFTIILRGIPEITEEIADKLFEAGCDDGSPASNAGVTYVTFNREADTLDAAFSSAAANVRNAGYDVERIEMQNTDLSVLAG